MPVQILMNLVAMPAFILAWYVAFTNWRPIRGDWWQADFIFFDNFIRMFSDEYFIGAIGRTLFILVVVVSIEFLIGFGLAIQRYLVRGFTFGAIKG